MNPKPGWAGRIKSFNTRDVKKGIYVLYWMQQSQRAEYNHVLWGPK